MALALLPDKSYEWIKCISNLILTNGLQELDLGYTDRHPP